MPSLFDPDALEAWARERANELSAKIVAEMDAIERERGEARRWCDDEEYIHNRVVRPRLGRIQALTAERAALLGALCRIEATRPPSPMLYDRNRMILPSEVA